MADALLFTFYIYVLHDFSQNRLVRRKSELVLPYLQAPHAVNCVNGRGQSTLHGTKGCISTSPLKELLPCWSARYDFEAF